MSTDNKFEWTDELVLMALDLAHHNGYHKFDQRCVDLFDEVKEQSTKSGYQYPKWVIKHIESKQNKPLFTTEDGKEVYEKDTFPVYKVDKDSFDILQFAACDCANWKGYKYFYSEDKAKEYILFHKPVLSLQDLLDNWESVGNGSDAYKTAPMFKGFKSVAQRKINGI